MPAFSSFDFPEKNTFMQAHLKATIVRLKSQLKSCTRERRLYKARLLTRDRRIAELERQNAELRSRLDPQRVYNHVYPAQMIAMAVFIVVQANGSLRCAASCAAYLAQLMGWDYGPPSASTVRNWVLRCGYYALGHAAELKGQYVGIIDESIQIGKEKLLLFLGTKVCEQSCRCAPLTHQDIEVIGMEVRANWVGDTVSDFISRQVRLHPGLNLTHIVSDRGTTLLAAMRKLGMSWVGDCTHLMMNAVKDIFANDSQLHQLYTQVGTLRRRMALSDWNFLMPPTLRDKDRFLRILMLVEWADRMDRYWDKLPAQGRKHISFYRQATPLIERMRQIKQLISLSSDILKKSGLSEYSCERWKYAIETYRAQQVDGQLLPQSERFIELIEGYFTQHAPLFNPEQGLLCCSDVIESTFGRYKNKGGMKVISADVLSIALYNRKIDTVFIDKAMTEVRQADLLKWQTENVCENRYRLIRRMNRELKSVA